MLWREDGHVLRRTADFDVEGQRKKGRLKRTWMKLIEVKVGLTMEDCRSKWIVGVNLIITKLKCKWPPSLVWDALKRFVLPYAPNILIQILRVDILKER